MSSLDDFFGKSAVSQSVTDAKAKMARDATDEELSELWFSNASDSDSDSASAVTQQTGSIWVYRKTPSITKYYDLKSVIGNPGQYGMVKEAIDKKTGDKYAVKVVNKRRFRDTKLLNSFFQDLRTEVWLMKCASAHKNIIEFRHCFEDLNNLYIVMSKCDGGELFDRIQKDETFTESKAAAIMLQMLSAVNDVHQRGIAHCDLKPENFLFRNSSESSPLVLIDFGMAKIVRWRDYYKRMNGTPYYIAPEVLAGKYNEACDVWSLGVILFIMIFGFPPFFDENEGQSKQNSDNAIYNKIKKGFQPKVLPGYGAWFPMDHPITASCRDLISRMLRKSVADRITAEEALDHPWLKGAAAKDTLQRTGMNPLVASLVSFKQTCRLQGEILSLLRECNYLNSSQVDSVKNFFADADKNGDGLISFDELFEALKRVDPDVTVDDCQSIIRSIDANTDGYMDFEELLSSRINRKLGSKEARLRKVFQALDLDNSGKISPDELQAALESVSDAIKTPLSRCMELIEEADRNGDGEIDYEEFLTMFHDTEDQ